eukprot:SAG22_NODE_2960_length_2071_cov_1.058824_2_plen_415_part_01
MLAEMDDMSTGDLIKDPEKEETAGDGQIELDEFLAWYLQIGVYYLEKPHFKNMKLAVPPMKDREKLFKQMDDDHSGELNYTEVVDAVAQLWPQVGPDEVKRAFMAADDDGGGLIGILEFKMLLGFMVYFNTNRHSIEELQNQFGGEDMTIDELYIAMSTLGHSLSDSAVENMFRLMVLEGMDPHLDVSPADVQTVKFDVFCAHVARKHGVEDNVHETVEEEIELLEDADEVNEQLQLASGQFGDVHLQDLNSVLNRRRKSVSIATPAAGSKVGGSKPPAFKRRMSVFSSMVRNANEKLQMVKNALRFTTATNSIFPSFSEDQLVSFVQMMYKQEYFVGQHIITQGEVGDAYFVMRRGSAKVFVDQKDVAQIEWGMCFGEVALVLDTMRTASIVAQTPWEVFGLSRVDYEEALNKM